MCCYNNFYATLRTIEGCSSFLKIKSLFGIPYSVVVLLVPQSVLLMPAPNDFFYYTNRERNAILVLLAILSASILYRIALPYCTPDPEPVDFSQWEADLQAFETGLYRQEQFKAKRRAFYQQRSAPSAEAPKADQPLTPTPFNPNTASAETLQALGLPQRTIKSILNYRAKGGRFRQPQDLAKIYTLSEAHFDQLEPYIQIPNTTSAASTGVGRHTTLAAATPAPLPPAFPFDPNTCTEEDWLALGVSARTTRSILNYRSKGGKFRQPEDLQKIYTLPDSVYQHLLPFIQLKEQPVFANYTKRPPKTYYHIDINQADAADFEQFRGIGPSYAKRILHYRELLGGFTSIDQVGEVYRLPDSTFQHIRPHLECPKHPLVPLNVNTASLETLKDHPYLSWRQARAIIQYRETKGPWKSVELVQILPELDDNKGTFERIRPYLTVN